MATKKGMTDIVTLLLKRRADINRKNKVEYYWLAINIKNKVEYYWLD